MTDISLHPAQTRDPWKKIHYIEIFSQGYFCREVLAILDAAMPDIVKDDFYYRSLKKLVFAWLP
jgi:hypothetical protein